MSIKKFGVRQLASEGVICPAPAGKIDGAYLLTITAKTGIAEMVTIRGLFNKGRHVRINTKNLMRSKMFGRLVYRLIRIYSKTLRLSIQNETAWRDHLENGGRILLCTWHQQFFSFIRHFQTLKAYRPSLMISQSSDGELIATVANLSGWHTVRGSSSKDGRIALNTMVNRLKKTGLGAHIVDGPKGPAGVVKRGVCQLAMDTGAMIVPVYAEATSKWIFNSWDHFFIPKPFSKVTIRYGDMIDPLTPGKAQKDFEAHRKYLETLMRPALIPGPAAAKQTHIPAAAARSDGPKAMPIAVAPVEVQPRCRKPAHS